jgi:hypothetical protein
MIVIVNCGIGNLSKLTKVSLHFSGVIRVS